MKKNTDRINKNITIETITNDDKKDIYVIIDGKSTLLLSYSGVSDYFWCDYRYNKDYIVTFSRGTMACPAPLVIETAYSIKNKKFIDLSDNKLREIFDYMLVSRRIFSLAEVLQTINHNNVDLDLLNHNEKSRLTDYLTQGNHNISNQQVSDYIISKYHSLSKFSDIEKSLTVREYNGLKSKLGNDFSFHAIPQDLDAFMNINYIDLDEKKKTKKLYDFD